MAECPESGSTNPAPEGGIACLDLSAALSLGQSKALAVCYYEFNELGQDATEEGKNSLALICRTCRCKVLKPNYGTLIEREVREFHKLTSNHICT